MKTAFAIALTLALLGDDPKPAPKAETPSSSILLDLRLQSLEREAAWLEALDKRLREGQPIEVDLLSGHAPEKAVEPAKGTNDGELEHSIQSEESRLRALQAELETRARLAAREPERASPVSSSNPASTSPLETKPKAATVAWIDPLLAGDLAFRQGDFERALDAYEQVPAAAPFADWASLRGARCLEKLGKLDEAEQRYADFRAKFQTGPFLIEAEFGLEIVRLKKVLEKQR
ncbi:MAG: tetratricopeptide repeat protein [Planctomycetes bacterium]|nr:tetratricopeptide repeat protein [Planctomycetota bacterium]MBI3843016.1 tetratricopeptide repeat protein [Planctomycetota bacterium]